ncbi:MAG: hypothetical protein ACYDDT_10790, partial [Sulfuricella sp.]
FIQPLPITIYLEFSNETTEKVFRRHRSFAGWFALAHASGDVERADSTTQLSTMSAEQKKREQEY